ncbi:MAG: hypothetical protein U0Y10_15080 [Spirosomataceae bacterium]
MKFIVLRFLILCAIYCILNVIADKYIYTKEFYYRLLSDNFSIVQIEKLLNSKKENIWIGYLLIPLNYLFKIAIISSEISLALYFTINRFEYKKVLKLVTTSEFIFLIPACIKLIWFLFIKTNFTPQELQNYYPLSLLSFVDLKSNDIWLSYPLKLGNLFEVIYWFLLSYSVSQIIQKKFWYCMRIIFFSYGIGLLFWVSLIMFLTVNLRG